MRIRKYALGCVAVLSLACGASSSLAASALGLAEGRMYEMVSPAFKGGYNANIAAAAPDGERVAFSSLGSFAGIQFPEAGGYYMAHRDEGTQEWVTAPVEPPFPPTHGFVDFSGDLRYTLGSRLLVSALGEDEEQFLLHPNSAPDLPQYWDGLITLEKTHAVVEQDANSDLCHIALNQLAGEGDLVPQPGQNEGHHTLYDLSRGCDGSTGSLRLVAVKNSIGAGEEPESLQPECELELGVGISGNGYLAGPSGPEQPASFNEVSGNGSEMFFTVGAPNGTTQCSNPQLFVRVGGSRTVEVSRPVEPGKPFGGCSEGAGEIPGEVPCQGSAVRPGAFFKGASEDGSKVFFTSTAPLVAGDTDLSNKLYFARIGCPEAEPGCAPSQRRVTSLIDASRSQIPGEQAEVLGVASVGGQAGRAYFVAHGVLTDAPNVEGEVAAKGAENLYVYDAERGTVAFVADLCSGQHESGTVEDLLCPSGLTAIGGGGQRNDAGVWGQGGNPGQAQTADDGRYLVFATYAKLVGRGVQSDTDNARDVYRYDAQTGVLDRVSAGEAGHDANGNGGGDAAIGQVGINPGGGFGGARITQETDTRAVSQDGSTVVFVSAEPLSGDAVNGLPNVYVWHEQSGGGRVSMISSGSSATLDQQQVIDLSGRNVFFVTTAGLAPRDTEGDADVYDARVDGGFREPPSQRVQCSSDACQGPLSTPAPMLVLGGTATQAPGEDYPPPKKATSKKRKAKARAKRAGRKAKRNANRAMRGKGSGRSPRRARTGLRAASDRGAAR